MNTNDNKNCSLIGNNMQQGYSFYIIISVSFAMFLNKT